MSDHLSDQPDAGKSRSGGGVQDQRRDRLKSALRENLKRRKAQARGRHDATAASVTDSPPDDRRNG